MASSITRGGSSFAAGSGQATASKNGVARLSVRIGSRPGAGTQRSTATFTFASNRARATFVCSLDARAFAACRTPKIYRRLAAGSHSFAVKASTGGRLSAPARYRWTIVKAVAPTVLITASPDSPSTSPDAVFTFSSSRIAATFQCSLDGGSFTACTSPTTYRSLARAGHTFSVRASASGLKSAPARFDWTVLNRYAATDPAALAAATSVGQAEQVLGRFFAQYGMTVSITNIKMSSFAQTFAAPTPIGEGDLPALKAYGAALVDEWSKYPVDFVRAINVREVVLVTAIGHKSGTVRAAMPDPFGDAMFYSVSFGSSDYARLVVHHELDHLFTFNLSGSFVPSDPTWVSLAPPGFHYGNGGVSCYVPGNTCLTGAHPIPGFVTGYAASGIDEDKAEMFAYLMHAGNYRLLKGWITSDSYLAAKVANYKSFLCGLSASMCGGYFDSINGG